MDKHTKMKLSINTEQSYRFFYYISIIFLLFTVMYYNVLWDIALLAILWFIAYLAGYSIRINNDNIIDIYLKSVLGIGIIGYLIWLSIEFDFDKLSVYVAATAILIIHKRDALYRLFRGRFKLHSYIESNYIFFICLNFILCCYIVFASQPISNYDALVKHVPITTDLLNGEGFSRNILESIVYGEVSLLRYGYTYMLILFGGNKVISLFEVFLVVLIFAGLFLMLRKFINNKFSDLLLLFIYFSTPLIINRSVTINPDVLPTLFLIASALIILNCSHEEAINKLPIIGMFFGFAAFSKMTSLPYLITITILLIAHLFINICKKKNTIHCMKTVFISIILFSIIFVPSLLLSWDKTGNPVFPFYNGFFKSPYYGTVNFTDPFDNNPLKLNLNSLLSMVFYTNKNIEMANGGIGYYLLLLPLVVFVATLMKNKSYICYSIMVLVSYFIATKFTSNIRYLLPSYLVAMVIIVVAVMLTVDYIKNHRIKICVMIIIILLLTTPNLVYIGNYMANSRLFYANEEMTKNPNFELLSYINNKNVKVLSYGDEFKGEFKGQFYNSNWYNGYLNNKLLSMEIDPIDYICSFDYLLYKKDADKVKAHMLGIFNPLDPKIQDVLEVFMESSTHILYKVNRSKNIKEINVLDELFVEGIQVDVTAPKITKFTPDCDEYKIVINSKYLKDNQVKGRFQINWHDKNNNLVDLYIKTYEPTNEYSEYISSFIKVPEGASYGILYINSNDEKKILVNEYKLIGYKIKNIIKDEENLLNNRALLKGGK